MKKILVPTDFSEQAENALKVAAQLAKKHNAEIYLLHMLELPLQEIDAMSKSSELPEAMFFMKLAHNKFQEVMAKDYLDGITVHETAKFDETFTQISNTCKEENIDLIVMGSHGASGFKEMFIGSNTEKVVRTSDVPVLVIKNEHKDFNIDRFVFASDFKNDNKETYKQATKFAEDWDAKMHLLLVNTASDFRTTSEAEEAMNDFIKDINFNGSLSEDLVNHAKRPVITFKI